MKTNSSDLIDTSTDKINQVSELTMIDANFSEDLNQENDSDIPVGLEYLAKIDLTPKQIVLELDRYIIGQNEAKRAIAIALRNRKRRMLLDPELRDEVTPKNILMIGPSGVGKTEIGRRAAKITGCPFLKIEATKFTEVGYIGRDVDSIPRDLVDSAFKSLREEEINRLQPQVLEAVENKIIDSFVPPLRSTTNETTDELKNKEKSIARNVFRKQLRDGLLDGKEIDVELAALPAGVEIMGPPGMEDMTNQLQNMLQNIGSARTRTRRMKVKDAISVIQKEEASKLLDEEDLKRKAIEWVEQYGIVFIDEIDKVCRRGEISGGADVSREGVQRDLLPLIEGCTVSTKYGMVRTDHILFIAAGAFHLSKPSDLVPELQGRLPIRVELKALTAKDFERILVEPQASLIVQYQALLGTEELELNFDNFAIQRIAEIAYDLNEKTENIGARRLYTVMERLLEEISFDASEYTDKKINIDVKYVDKYLTPLAQDQDTSHFIL